MTSKKRLIKTNRLHLVRALHATKDSLPQRESLRGWCIVAEKALGALGYAAYCHLSAQIGLLEHAQSVGETQRYMGAVYHCDLQHDLSMLNRDTVDPSGANTDPLFPHDSLWIFSNDVGDYKTLSLGQLEKCHSCFSSVSLDRQFMIASDGHRCLSEPELFIEEYFVRNKIRHVKEGDVDTRRGRKWTEYPLLQEEQTSKRPKEADWIVYEGSRYIFVEYFEGRLDEKYFAAVALKRQLCRINGISLIEIWRKDLTVSRLDTLFARVMRNCT